MPTRHHILSAAAALVIALSGVACSDDSASVARSETTPTTAAATAASSTTAPAATLHILVTNDDGVGAPGIDAVVEALRKVPATEVTVVAPATNQSGTDGKTTPGTLAVTDATTASGYPAKSVQGYPADTVIWAIDQHGIATKPDLVVSGINLGQNVGPLASISGTVGAAKAAGKRGIPALAASQGIGEGAPTADFPSGVKQVLDWVATHRGDLAGKGPGTGPAEVLNLNIPTCPTGGVRGVVNVPLGTGNQSTSKVDCTSTKTDFADDIEAFVNGFAAIAPVPVG